MSAVVSTRAAYGTQASLKYPDDVISSTPLPTTPSASVSRGQPPQPSLPLSTSPPLVRPPSLPSRIYPRRGADVNPRVHFSLPSFTRGAEEAGRGPPHAPRIRADMFRCRPLRNRGARVTLRHARTAHGLGYLGGASGCPDSFGDAPVIERMAWRKVVDVRSEDAGVGLGWRRGRCSHISSSG